MHYQPGHSDQMLHRYEYDADNRITHVYTSTDGTIWDNDAHYQYYRHGPLARMELGEHLVQGVDYAYTIHGWIKGINSNVLHPEHDMGHDGSPNDGYISGQFGRHQHVARDAVAYSLSYFQGDYTPINKRHLKQNYLEASMTASAFGAAVPDLWNGNIARMVVSLSDTANHAMPVHGYAYRYDQLNRLNHMQAHTGITGNTWPGSGSELATYRVDTIGYDANGNILTLKRHGNLTGGNEVMDNLTYHYTSGKNQLLYVDDAVPQGRYDNDIDDQAPNNYSYDEIGNLVADVAEEIDQINWFVNGKIKSIIRTQQSSKPNLYFEYGPDGQRVRKHVAAGGNTISDTWYVRDAQGNVMATYTYDDETQDTTQIAQEFYLYGSSRLGSHTRNVAVAALTAPADTSRYARILGYKQYELINHLGNVLSTITDQKEPVDTDSDDIVDYWLPRVLTVTDYYPFGMQMPGRVQSTGEYRFGFNGKESDNDVSGTGNQYNYGFRIFNPRIGRFLSVDPLFGSYPWYSTYHYAGNTPIKAIDLDGLEPVLVGQVYGRVQYKASVSGTLGIAYDGTTILVYWSAGGGGGVMGGVAAGATLGIYPTMKNANEVLGWSINLGWGITTGVSDAKEFSLAFNFEDVNALSDWAKIQLRGGFNYGIEIGAYAGAYIELGYTQEIFSFSFISHKDLIASKKAYEITGIAEIMIGNYTLDISNMADMLGVNVSEIYGLMESIFDLYNDEYFNDWLIENANNPGKGGGKTNSSNRIKGAVTGAASQLREKLNDVILDTDGNN